MNKKTKGSVIILAVLGIVGYFLFKILSGTIAFVMSTGSLIVMVLFIFLVIYGIKRVISWING